MTNSVPLQTYAAPAGLTVVGNAKQVGIVAAAHGESHDLCISGDYAYVIASGAFDIYDVHKKTAPVLVSSIATASGDTLDVSGGYAVIATLSGNSLQIVDISNPAAPILLATVADSTLTGCQGVKLMGKYAICACTTGRVTVVDVTTATVVSSLLDATNMAGISDVAVRGRYAYVGGGSAGKLSVIDLVNPAAPVRRGSVAGPAFTTWRIDAQGRYVYVIAANNSTLTVFDVANPTAPVQVGQLNDAALGLSLRFAVSGHLAIVTTQQDPTLFAIVNVTDPASPVVAQQVYPTVTTGEHNYGCAFDGRYAYTINFNLIVTDLVGAAGTDNARNIDSLTAGVARIRKYLDVNGPLRAAAGYFGLAGILSDGPIASRGIVQSGASNTAGRPDPVAAGTGARWYDTTLAKPIWSNGTTWKDATGTTV